MHDLEPEDEEYEDEEDEELEDYEEEDTPYDRKLNENSSSRGKSSKSPLKETSTPVKPEGKKTSGVEDTSHSELV